MSGFFDTETPTPTPDPCVQCSGPIDLSQPVMVVTVIQMPRGEVHRWAGTCSSECAEKYWAAPAGELAPVKTAATLDRCAECGRAAKAAERDAAKDTETAAKLHEEMMAIECRHCSRDGRVTPLFLDTDTAITVRCAFTRDLRTFDVIAHDEHPHAESVNAWWQSEEPDGVTERIAARERARQAEAAAILTPEAEALGLP